MVFQAKLSTKIQEYSIDDVIVELSDSVDREQLNHIVKNALASRGQDSPDRNFDFLVGGRFLRQSVDKHLELYADEIDAKTILSEKLVDIEYVLSIEPPKPSEAVPHDDWVSSVDSNSCYILTGSYDNSIKIFAIDQMECVATINGAHEKPVTQVRWLGEATEGQKRNELHFVSTGHDEISVLHRFNTKTKKVDQLFIYRGHNRSVNCVDSQEDLIATGSFDKTLRVWSAGLKDTNGTDENNPDVNCPKRKKVKSSIETACGKTGRSAIITLTGHQESVTGVKWLGSSNEYNSLATCSMDRTICVWDIEVGECKRKVLSSKPLLGIDFSNEYNLILSASCDRHIRLWDARAPDNATAKAAYTSHDAWVSCVSFCEDQHNFVSGGYDNLVKLWDIRSPKACLYDLMGHRDKVLDICCANSDMILSGSADSTMKVFLTKNKK